MLFQLHHMDKYCDNEYVQNIHGDSDTLLWNDRSVRHLHLYCRSGKKQGKENTESEVRRGIKPFSYYFLSKFYKNDIF